MDDAAIPFDVTLGRGLTNVPTVESETLNASQPYVGRWQRLVSTTNWEKGAIIAQWRETLQAQNVPATQFADETWAQLVGGVSGQHVGRLRRVFQRFGTGHEQYEGLFWSHFQAALDWPDAEMWLEGAARSGWSVSAMRRMRWEALGAVEADRPQEQDIVATEPEEDFTRTADSFDEASAGPRYDGPDFGDDAPPSPAPLCDAEHEPTAPLDAEGSVTAVRPFADLPSLPDDVTDAFEQFKLVILRHKAEGWEAISRDDLVATLEALKLLALTE